MRVLVTGASGFAGRHLLRALHARGVRDVIACGHEIDAAGGGRPDHPTARWLELDVTSDAAVAAAVQAHSPTHVYHLAGQSSVGRSFARPLETWEVNATGTWRLVNALRASAAPGCRLLVISSAEVYGRVPESRQPIAEVQPMAPLTPYGASKAAAEVAALQAKEAGDLEVVVARSFNHTGPGQDVRFALPNMAAQLVRLRGGEPPVLKVGDLSARRDMADVRDVAEAYVLLMERGENGGTYNVCSGTAYSIEEMVRLLVEISGTEARLERDPARVRPVDIPLLVGDPSRLEALGWQARIPIDQTMGDLFEDVERSI